MATSIQKDGPTPGGGVRSEIIFLKNGVAADESEADSAEVVEYDQAGSAVRRTYLVKTPPAGGPPSG